MYSYKIVNVEIAKSKIILLCNNVIVMRLVPDVLIIINVTGT